MVSTRKLCTLSWADMNPETGRHAKASNVATHLCPFHGSPLVGGALLFATLGFHDVYNRPSHHNKQNHNPTSRAPLLSPGLVLQLHPRAA